MRLNKHLALFLFAASGAAYAANAQPDDWLRVCLSGCNSGYNYCTSHGYPVEQCAADRNACRDYCFSEWNPA